MKIEIEIGDDVVEATGRSAEEHAQAALEAYLSQLFRERRIGDGHIERGLGYGVTQCERMLIRHGVYQFLNAVKDHGH